MPKENEYNHIDTFISNLEHELPSYFTRQAACRYIDGLYTPKYLANLDAKGLGPQKKIHIGKKVCYERKDFLAWLSSNMKHTETRN